MDSKTGKVLTLASSNRFNPEKIRKEDISSLNVNAVEYQFEPGSVIKPLSISLAMDKGLVKKNEIFLLTIWGKMEKVNFKRFIQIGQFNIKMTTNLKKYLTLEEIVMFSSNIGTLQIAQRLWT